VPSGTPSSRSTWRPGSRACCASPICSPATGTAPRTWQTSLAKLYLSWERVQQRELVDGYVRRIMVNENNSLWRRAQKRKEVSAEALPEHVGVEDRPDDGTRAALWEFVQTLPRKQRAVVVLRFYEDLSETEVAELRGISVGTAKSQSSRALATLRRRVHSDPVLARDGAEER
jgi:RNA polymerase sigma-70 factor (sigma-E family)